MAKSIAALTLVQKSVMHFEAHEAIVQEYPFRWLAYLCSSTARRHRKQFNSTMDQLVKVDPDCPNFRL